MHRCRFGRVAHVREGGTTFPEQYRKAGARPALYGFSRCRPLDVPRFSVQLVAAVPETRRRDADARRAVCVPLTQRRLQWPLGAAESDAENAVQAPVAERLRHRDGTAGLTVSAPRRHRFVPFGGGDVNGRPRVPPEVPFLTASNRHPRFRTRLLAVRLLYVACGDPALRGHWPRAAVTARAPVALQFVRGGYRGFRQTKCMPQLPVIESCSVGLGISSRTLGK